MSPRNSVILALLVLLVLGVYVYTSREDEGGRQVTAPRTVFDVTREEVRTITVDRGDGSILRLERADAASGAGDAGAASGAEGDSGAESGPGNWRLTEPVVWNADRSRMVSLLGILERMSAERSLTEGEGEGAAEGEAAGGEASGQAPAVATGSARASDPQARADYGLDKPRAVITVGTAGGEKRLIVGDPTPVGLAFYAYVEGGDEIFTVSAYDILPFVEPPDNYRDRAIVSVNLSDVRRLEIETASDSVTVVKDGEAWNMVEPDQHPANDQVITELLTPVTTLVAREFIDEPESLETYGLAEPQAVVRLTVGEGESETTHVLYVGKPTGEEGMAYVKREGPVVFVAALDPAPLAEVTPVGVALRDLVLTSDIFTQHIELLTKTGFSLTLIKHEEDGRIRWTTGDGHVVEPRMMTDFLGAVIALDAQDLGRPVEDVSAVNLDYVTLRLQPPPGQGGEGWPRLVRIGAPDGSGSVEAVVNTRNRVYTMPEQALTDLLARAREIYDAAYAPEVEEGD